MDMREFLIYMQGLYLTDRFWTGIDELEDPRDILKMDKKDLESIPGSYKTGIQRILKTRDDKEYLDQVFDDLKICTRVYTLADEDYPKRLRLIEDPPRVLYTRGQDLSLSATCIAIVGARKSTAYGKYVAEKFTKDLADLGVTIISGMAQGIDSLAHKFALERDTYSIGVLGCGVDQIFPKSNKALFEKMYERGTIVSEYPPGFAPRPENFPRRNRIISALSEAVIVVEAKDQSGSLITARLGADQSKEVFAVPGNINSLYSQGTNKLIRDGAIPLLEMQDIIDRLPQIKEEQTTKPTPQIPLTKDEEEILNLIDQGFGTIDKLVEKTGKTVQELSPIITLLEMKSVVRDMDMEGFKRI